MDAATSPRLLRPHCLAAPPSLQPLDGTFARSIALSCRRTSRRWRAPGIGEASGHRVVPAHGEAVLALLLGMADGGVTMYANAACVGAVIG